MIGIMLAIFGVAMALIAIWKELFEIEAELEIIAMILKEDEDE
jgi:hypothetical protein